MKLEPHETTDFAYLC